MNVTTLKSVMMQALKPRRFTVMTAKVIERATEREGLLSRQQNSAWITEHLTDFAALAEDWDRYLWAESLGRSREIEARAQQTLKLIPRDFILDFIGGGAYPFLHFLARYMRPGNVVETGVAAGFSSFAFLDALELNKYGMLYSSDFPYFRLSNPEQYIGIVVPQGLRHNWRLYIEGDKRNLPNMLNDMAGKINLFHYDSDKSYRGRKRAMSVVQARLASDAVVLMDDIQDNSFFHDYVINYASGRPYWLFEFEGKFVGMIGEPVRGY